MRCIVFEDKVNSPVYWIYTLTIATYCMNKRGLDCALPRTLHFRRFSSFSSCIHLSFSSCYPGSLHFFFFFLYCVRSRTTYLSYTSRLRVSLLHHYTTKFSWDLPVQNSFLCYLTRSHCKKSTLQCFTHAARCTKICIAFVGQIHRDKSNFGKTMYMALAVATSMESGFSVASATKPKCAFLLR